MFTGQRPTSAVFLYGPRPWSLVTERVSPMSISILPSLHRREPRMRTRFRPPRRFPDPPADTSRCGLPALYERLQDPVTRDVLIKGSVHNRTTRRT